MLNNKAIAVVVPAYNEGNQILHVLESMPSFVDHIVVVDDCSADGTASIVSDFISKIDNRALCKKPKNRIVKATKHNRADLILKEMDLEEKAYYAPAVIMNERPEEDRIILIKHKNNSGVGAAISTGYKWCLDHQIDCTAVMAGDGQMDPDELESICKPVVLDGIDYAKGNRLIHRSAWIMIPKARYLGNSILSILTKIASGYWHISDTQSGYTAISLSALKAIKIYAIYKKYGMPNDLLVKLNIAFCTIKEIPIKPVYNIGEKSKMKLLKVIPGISWLLFKSFFKRLWVKYLVKDFHPLFLLYHLSFFLWIMAIPYMVKILKIMIFTNENVSTLTVLAFFFLFTSAFQSMMFAMWMDIQDNERLYR